MKKLINFNFNGTFCEELSALKKSFSIGEVSTMYCTTPPSKMVDFTTETYIAEAICNYLGKIDTMHLFVGKTAKNEYVCEYKRSGKEDTQICIGKINGSGKFQFKAADVSPDRLITSYGTEHKGTQFVMAMMPVITQDYEARNFVDNIVSFDIPDYEMSRAMCGLSNHIYYRLKDEKSEAPIRYENEFKTVTQKDIDEVTITCIYTGEPTVFTQTDIISEDDPKPSSIIPTCELRDLYPINSKRVLTDEEEQRVPQLGDYYVVPEWSRKTAKRIADSNRFRKNIRNILLYGPSGSGKTEGSQAIAEMLGLPYYTYTCSADDDKFDLIGQIIPNTSNGKKAATMDEICQEIGIPTFSDVENDYASAFTKLFGKAPGKLDSEADCYQEITKRLLEHKTENENDFIYVESEIISAIKNGGFCEIQEANIIKRSSVMEALNPLLAESGDGSFIKLATGEIVHRHPDCVIAFTINRDYEGCNNIQEAVYSRINFIKQIPEPDANELFERTKAQTGFTNDLMLRKMAKCVVEIHEYCRERDITGGVCGPRELIDWAQVAILESEDCDETTISEETVIAAALETIIEKVAQNEDDIEDVVTGAFKKHFTPSIIDKLRK